MIKFSQNIKITIEKGEKKSVAVALNQAQLWLKNVTRRDLQTWLDKLSLHTVWKRDIRLRLENFDLEEKSFQSAYYWAGFTAIGK